MAYQTVFKRYELKHLLTKEQKETILRAMKPYMDPTSMGGLRFAISILTQIITV